MDGWDGWDAITINELFFGRLFNLRADWSWTWKAMIDTEFYH